MKLTKCFRLAICCLGTWGINARYANAAPQTISEAPVPTHRYYVAGASALASDASDGSLNHPWKTIQQAADKAAPGDTILVAPGTYHESVLLKQSGQPGQPITFEAMQRHGVIVSGQEPERTWLLRSAGSNQAGNLTAKYITVRGFVFQDATGPRDWTEMVTMATGWRLEDCILRGSPGHYADAVTVRGDDCVLLRDICEDNGMNGMAGANARNLHIQDCILRRNNRLPEMPGGNCGACKFLFTTGLRAEGIISYDNFGSGWWLDWDNRDFAITNSTFFGNHAGAYRYGRTDRKEYNQAQDAPWSGVGIWSEGNPGPGLIANNTIYSNLAAGVGILESGFTAPITVRDNTIVDCDRGIELRAMKRGDHVLGRCVITGNRIENWHDAAIGTSLEDTITVDRPQDSNIVIDGNSYSPSPATTLFSWYNHATTHRTVTHSLDESRRLLGVETTGTLQPKSFTTPLLPVRKTTLADWTEDRKAIDQVPARGVEAMTIDAALTGAKAQLGQSVAIPVFGRKQPLYQQGHWYCEVYDLNARFVRLELPTEPARHALERIVTPYTVIQPKSISMRLTQWQPYVVAGVYLDSK